MGFNPVSRQERCVPGFWEKYVSAENDLTVAMDF